GIGLKIPIQFELGDGFIIAWCAYLVLFAVSLMGPRTNFSKALSSLMSEGWHNVRNNYLLGMLTWFSILIVVSVVIDSVQQSFGILTEPPEIQNKLIQFFRITTSPLTEEIGFRMFLIGLPLFAMFATKASIGSFFKSLWHPSQNLEITNYKKVLGLIIVVGIFFGAAHIISGSPWSTGKFAQAAISGVIIGWVYVRHGLAPAILLHWATNYVIFSYIFFMSGINQTSNEASNPFLNTLEILFLIAGTLAIIIFILNYLKSKKESTALV
ncbi:MAG: CPBP family intramembrane glutamic endopeptidase, partial [Nitrosopumilaceae archaeon]